MGERYLKDTVVAKRYDVHRTTPWRWSTNGTGFPKPVTLSPGCTRWRLSDLERWEAEKALSESDASRRKGEGASVSCQKSQGA